MVHSPHRALAGLVPAAAAALAAAPAPAAASAAPGTGADAESLEKESAKRESQGRESLERAARGALGQLLLTDAVRWGRRSPRLGHPLPPRAIPFFERWIEVPAATTHGPLSSLLPPPFPHPSFRVSCTPLASSPSPPSCTRCGQHRPPPPAPLPALLPMASWLRPPMRRRPPPPPPPRLRWICRAGVMGLNMRKYGCASQPEEEAHCHPPLFEDSSIKLQLIYCKNHWKKKACGSC